MTPIVFVSGATGRQGSAVARQLLDIGWTVRATTRNMGSTTAKDLKEQGAEMRPGGWEDGDVLKDAMDGCTHLFLNVIPNHATGTSEVPLAKRMLDIARNTGVKHVV